MGCIGHRRKDIEFKAEQKWDYINLKDFRSRGCGTPSAYVYLWISLFLSIAVYAVDSFTAVNLLVFDRWSSDIKPAIDVNISKYIFAICIILSFVNIAWEWVRAARVMKRGNIAECYLDNLAVRWESIRMGNGQGWRRFLVFAELTKSKKGAEYIALFTYFSFQSWVRVIVCTGPRQVVNAFTLKAVYDSDLLVAEKDIGSSFSTFFSKLQVLAESDYRQAVILSGMVFTLVIWAFSVLFLLAGVLFYLLFLLHWIPRADGGLTGYCERKINKALLKIVTDKVNKALARQEQDRWKAEAKAAKKNGEKPALERTATLPTIPDIAFSTDKLPEMPSLARAPTIATLPEYTSRPASPGGFELGAMDQKRTMPTRTNTSATATTYSSRVSLLSSAADMGYAGSSAGAPPPIPRPADPYRPGTSQSMRSMAARNNMAQQQRQQQPPLPPLSTYAREYTETPMAMDDDIGPFGPPVRSPTAYSVASNYGRSPTAASVANSYGRSPTAASVASFGRSPTAASAGGFARPPRSAPTPRPQPPYNNNYNNDDDGNGFSSPVSAPTPRPQFYGNEGRASPAPSMYSTASGMTNATNMRATPAPPMPLPMNRPGFQPMRSATNPMPPRGPALYSPQPVRNMTGSVPPQMVAEAEEYYQYDGSQHGTSPPQRGDPSSSFNFDLEGQGQRRQF